MSTPSWLCWSLLGLLTAVWSGIAGPAEAASAGHGRHSAGPAVGAAMKIWSEDFKAGEVLPVRLTCDGEDTSPALSWSGVPADARSLALVIEDPDAPRGTWVHWLVINLPAASAGLPAGGKLPAGAVEVPNDFGRPGYGGPCPPSGTHRYFFRLIALDVPALRGITRGNYTAEFARHQVVQAELMGQYRRR